MEKLKIFYLKYKHAVPLIIYAIIYMTWFAWLEKNNHRTLPDHTYGGG